MEKTNVTLLARLIEFGRSAALAVLFLPFGNAFGDVRIDVVEENGGVTLSWEGTIDTTGLISDGTLGADSTGIGPAAGNFDGEGHGNESPNSSIYLFNNNVLIPTFSFGTGNFVSAGDVDPTSSFLIESGSDEMALPLNYVSGEEFSGSMFFSGQTIASLGISTTPFEVMLPDGAGTVYFFPVEQFAGSDDFNDNDRNELKWGDDLVNGDGALEEANGRLEYTVVMPVGNNNPDNALRPWESEANSDEFDIIVDITIPVSPNSGYVNFGIYLEGPSSSSDRIFWGLARGANESGFLSTFESTSENAEYAVTPHPNVTICSVRLSYDPVAKIFTAYYDMTGSADGYQWEKYKTYGVGPNGGGDLNKSWQLSANGEFGVALNPYSEDEVLGSGDAYADNFLHNDYSR